MSDEAGHKPCVPAADWLAALDPDPARAEDQYHQLIRDLTRFLEWQHPDPEWAAQETMVRGLTRIANGVSTSGSGVRAYLFGIAKNVVLESRKKAGRERSLDEAESATAVSSERQYDRVDAKLTLIKAMKHLTAWERHVLVRYFTDDDREALGRELRLRPGNLRVIVHRIRRKLERALRLHRRDR